MQRYASGHEEMSRERARRDADVPALNWLPGEVRVDFGKTDFRVSNGGQIFWDETAKCVCQGAQERLRVRRRRAEKGGLRQCHGNRQARQVGTTRGNQRRDSHGQRGAKLLGRVFHGRRGLLCALDRVFDRTSVFMMCGPSYRGRGLDTYSFEAVPQATKVRWIQPKGV